MREVCFEAISYAFSTTSGLVVWASEVDLGTLDAPALFLILIPPASRIIAFHWFEYVRISPIWQDLWIILSQKQIRGGASSFFFVQNLSANRHSS